MAFSIKYGSNSYRSSQPWRQLIPASPSPDALIRLVSQDAHARAIHLVQRAVGGSVVEHEQIVRAVVGMTRDRAANLLPFVVREGRSEDAHPMCQHANTKTRKHENPKARKPEHTKVLFRGFVLSWFRGGMFNDA